MATATATSPPPDAVTPRVRRAAPIRTTTEISGPRASTRDGTVNTAAAAGQDQEEAAAEGTITGTGNTETTNGD